MQVFPPPAGAFAATVGAGSNLGEILDKELQMRLRRYFAPILVRDEAAGCSQCSSKFGVLRRRVRPLCFLFILELLFARAALLVLTI